MSVTLWRTVAAGLHYSCSCCRPLSASHSACEAGALPHNCSFCAVSAAMDEESSALSGGLTGLQMGVARPERKLSSRPLAARMRPKKRGLGLKGRDLNSGWNCAAT